MTDSSERDRLDEKHRKNREQRIESIKRWVRYVRENPPEKWGEQQNALVNSQLAAARKSGVSAEQYRRVERAADERDRER
jgi:hypothetical protein